MLNEAAQQGAPWRADRHHGCRLDMRLSCDALRAQAHGRYCLYRQRRQHRCLTESRLCPAIAVVNAGSSSIKFAMFDAAETPSLQFKGLIEGIGATPHAKLVRRAGRDLARRGAGAGRLRSRRGDASHDAACGALARRQRDISAVGHRVVHGGGEFAAPLRVTGRDRRKARRVHSARAAASAA